MKMYEIVEKGVLVKKNLLCNRTIIRSILIGLFLIIICPPLNPQDQSLLINEIIPDPLISDFVHLALVKGQNFTSSTCFKVNNKIVTSTVIDSTKAMIKLEPHLFASDQSYAEIQAVSTSGSATFTTQTEKLLPAQTIGCFIDAFGRVTNMFSAQSQILVSDFINFITDSSFFNLPRKEKMPVLGPLRDSYTSAAANLKDSAVLILEDVKGLAESLKDHGVLHLYEFYAILLSFDMYKSFILAEYMFTQVFFDVSPPVPTIVGTQGDDEITGTDRRDFIVGRGGSDRINAGKGSDRVDGGDEDDYMYGEEGNDVMFGGRGGDVISGGLENDWISGGIGDDWIYGDEGKDNLRGGDGADNIDGGEDNDKIDGGPGNDFWLAGGLGDDIILGGEGKDTIFGNGGVDAISGGPGDDEIFISAGHVPTSNIEIIVGGPGQDTLIVGPGIVHIRGFPFGELYLDTATFGFYWFFQ